MGSDATAYWQALLAQRNGDAFDRETNIRICKVCDRPMQLSDPLRVREPLALLGHNVGCAALRIYAQGLNGSSSDASVFWQSFLLPRNGRVGDLQTNLRVCIVCDEPMRLDNPTQVQPPHGVVGHDPDCRSFTIAANGVDDSGGVGGIDITWGSSGITFADSSLTFGTLTT